MREAAESLAFRAMAVGENFRDENPDHRSLSNRVCGNERENAYRHDDIVLGEKPPGHKAEREDVAEGSDVEKSPAAETVDQPKPDKREYQVSETDADGLQQRCFRRQSSEFKNAGSEIENCVDA